MQENGQEKSFAELLEESELKTGAELKPGDKVQGKIIALGKEQVYVDTGTKADGAIDKSELCEEDGQFPYQVGDTLSLYVVSSKQNEIRLGKTLGSAGGLDLLEQARQSSIPVDGKVKETCKGGFKIKIGEHTGFCPLSQMDIKRIQDPEAYTGQQLSFLIVRIEERGKNIVLSRRAVLEKEQSEALKKFSDKYKPGDLISGEISRLEPYGAFAKLEGGLEGLIHVSEMSWSKNLMPEEIVSLGQTVDLKIIEITEQEKGMAKIALSMKQAQADPWDDAQERFKPGTVQQGTVTRTAPFGVFVELAPGLEGLVHISEMSYLKRVHKPEDEVSPGDPVDVMLKEVNPESRRISLSMRDAEGDPWIGVENRYSKGQTVEGELEKNLDFGLFIRLEPGIVGLLPSSKINQSPEAAEILKKKPGDKVFVSVESIDTENKKISLIPAKDSEALEWKKYAPKNEESLGLLGQKLNQALKGKKTS